MDEFETINVIIVRNILHLSIRQPFLYIFNSTSIRRDISLIYPEVMKMLAFSESTQFFNILHVQHSILIE